MCGPHGSAERGDVADRQRIGIDQIDVAGVSAARGLQVVRRRIRRDRRADSDATTGVQRQSPRGDRATADDVAAGGDNVNVCRRRIDRPAHGDRPGLDDGDLPTVGGDRSTGVVERNSRSAKCSTGSNHRAGNQNVSTCRVLVVLCTAVVVGDQFDIQRSHCRIKTALQTDVAGSDDSQRDRLCGAEHNPGVGVLADITGLRSFATVSRDRDTGSSVEGGVDVGKVDSCRPSSWREHVRIAARLNNVAIRTISNDDAAWVE